MTNATRPVMAVVLGSGAGRDAGSRSSKASIGQEILDDGGPCGRRFQIARQSPQLRSRNEGGDVPRRPGSEVSGILQNQGRDPDQRQAPAPRIAERGAVRMVERAQGP